MTTTDPRWTDETEATAVTAVKAWIDQYNGEPEPDTAVVRVVLAALADAGLLTPPGGQTREELGVDFGGTGQVDVGPESDVRRWYRNALDVRWAGTRLMARTIHVGPWQPADATEET